MNLSNTPINFGTDDQDVQLVKKCGNSSSSSYSRGKSQRKSKRSSSFDSCKMVYLNNGSSMHDLAKNSRYSFRSYDKVSNISIESEKNLLQSNYESEIFNDYDESLDIMDLK